MTAQHGYRRDYTRHETENGRVVLPADPIKNGRIIERIAVKNSVPQEQAGTVVIFPGVRIERGEFFLSDRLPSSCMSNYSEVQKFHLTDE